MSWYGADFVDHVSDEAGAAVDVLGADDGESINGLLADNRR